MVFAAALSEHPLATHAVGETVGQLIDTIGPKPDLVLLFAGAAHTGVLEDIVRTTRRLLEPALLVGSSCATVFGAGHATGAGGLALWAARGLDAIAEHLTRPHLHGGDTGARLVLADPFSFPVDALLHGARTPVVGGFASAGRGPGGNRLVLDGAIHTEGAVSIRLSGVRVETVVSQGCRPVGEPVVVTRADGRLVHELAGRPALAHVREVIAALPVGEDPAPRRSLHVGRVVDRARLDVGRGDFLIGALVGGDRDTGTIALDDDVDVGTTLQLHVRDAHAAEEDLRYLLYGRDADAALLFTSTDRIDDGMPDAALDAAIVDDALGPAAVAGMTCADVFGPIGGRSFRHGHAASIVLFGDRASTGGRSTPG